MNNEQVINNSGPSVDRYNNIPVLGKTQIIPTEVIMEKATQVIPNTQNSINNGAPPSQVVPVEQVFTPHVVQQKVIHQPYQNGAVTMQQQVVQQPQVQVQQQVVQQQVQQPTAVLVDDNELQKEFIGTNFDSIMNKKFNIFAFLFTFVYYFYRKMYLYAILLTVLMIGLPLLTRSVIMYIILCVLVGILTNTIYKRFSMRKVQLFKEEVEDNNIDTIKELCRDEGNTSVGAILFGTFAELIVGSILAIIIFIFLLSKIEL